MKFFVLPLLSFLFFTQSVMAADSVDIIVVLDRSGSITRNMPTVKEYVKRSIFRKIAQPEDSVYIFSFDGKFRFDKMLSGSATDAEIDAVLAEIKPLGWYTDLTNAVESMRQYIQQNCDPKKKKVVFFLTDGLNDPPSFSPYKGGLQHRFFNEAKKEVASGGWKVFVTGIGDKTDAGNIAAIVGADYVELSSNPTLSEFDEKLTTKLKKARSGFGFFFWAGIAAAVLAAAGGGFYFYNRR